jgi:hypothetical protein
VSETFPSAAFGENVRTFEVAVRTDKGRVEAFKQETFSTLPGIPLTFPFCWLTLPEVRANITDMIDASQLPLHETQNFYAEHPLAIDMDYIFHVIFKRLENPLRLTIQAEVRQPDGLVLTRMETLLRILPLAFEAV